MSSDKPIVLVGAGEQGEIAYEYFTRDSPREIAGFSVEGAYLESDTFLGLPLVPFEELATHYPPDRYDAFVAVSSTKLNRPRARLFRAVKDQGYTCPSYVSSGA